MDLAVAQLFRDRLDLVELGELRTAREEIAAPVVVRHEAESGVADVEIEGTSKWHGGFAFGAMAIGRWFLAREKAAGEADPAIGRLAGEEDEVPG